MVLALIVFLFAVSAFAQQRPQQRVPVESPPGWPQQRVDAGLPWPQGLGKKEVLTGHIRAVDKDQLMVRSLDYGEVLFWVDEKTIVRVDKVRLELADLRVGDPVAVKMRNVKGRGPVATEILPHPDVRDRKQRGEPASTANAAASTSPPSHGAVLTAEAPAAAAPAAVQEPPPTLPAGASGITGTISKAEADALEVRDTNNQSQKVLVTGLTLYKRAGSGSIVSGAREGDRVAVVGDRLDSGEWIAREILFQASQADGKSGGTAAASDVERLRDGVVRVTGAVADFGADEIRVKTAAGERAIMVTGGTAVNRMGIRGTIAALRKGDQVEITGDLLEGGLIIAREITVTKLAGT